VLHVRTEGEVEGLRAARTSHLRAFQSEARDDLEAREDLLVQLPLDH
jgi:hypothetical protein